MSEDRSKTSLLSGLLARLSGKRSRKANEPTDELASDPATEPASDNLIEGEAADIAVSQEAASPTPTPEPAAEPAAEHHFTIRLAVGEEALERLKALLMEEERITSVALDMAPADPAPAESPETARNALRITCETGDLSAFMEEIRAILRRRMRAVDYHHLSIDRY